MNNRRKMLLPPSRKAMGVGHAPPSPPIWDLKWYLAFLLPVLFIVLRSRTMKSTGSRKARYHLRSQIGGEGGAWPTPMALREGGNSIFLLLFITLCQTLIFLLQMIIFRSLQL